MNQSETFRSGFVAIVGRPNVGKSTLLNQILGEKIAIVSNRPQTTRNTITGIYNTPQCQAVFMDTPGFLNPKNRLGQYMAQSIQDALEGIDALVILADASEFRTRDLEIARQLAEKKTRKFFCLNKIDLIRPQELLSLIDRVRQEGYDSIYPISAKEGDGVQELLKDLCAGLPHGPKYFPDDILTDQPERAICAEIIREKALRSLRDEVPHGIGVELIDFREEQDRVVIHATIYCEKDSHKGIIIGKNGSKLKEIGSLARTDIEELLDAHVNLQLWVKVRPDWRNNINDLKTLGYVKQK